MILLVNMILVSAPVSGCNHSLVSCQNSIPVRHTLFSKHNHAEPRIDHEEQYKKEPKVDTRWVGSEIETKSTNGNNRNEGGPQSDEVLRKFLDF